MHLGNHMETNADLDELDIRILKILQKDASLTATEIAQQVCLSQSPCWRRINRLQEAGYIKNKVALLDRDKLNLGIVSFVSIRLSSQGRNSLEEFEQTIVDYPEVVECWTISGNMDYILRIVTRDIASYEHFLRNHLLKLEYIIETQSHISMTEVKNTTELPI